MELRRERRGVSLVLMLFSLPGRQRDPRPFHASSPDPAWKLETRELGMSVDEGQVELC